MSKAKLKASGVPSESAEQKWVIQWSQQPSVQNRTQSCLKNWLFPPHAQSDWLVCSGPL